jgi:poly(3-hydroxybutyrate) depolymerase
VDGVCALVAPSCGLGGQAGTAGQGGSGGGSAGCGKAGAATGVLDLGIPIAGQTRTYVLSVPANYTGTTPLALVFAWHGANVNGTIARNGIFNLEATVNSAAIFVYPNGAIPSGWDTSPGSADFQVFPELLSSISSSYCIDPNRVFSTGHSTGAVLTSILGCTQGNSLRAIAPVEGTPPGAGRTCTGKVAAMIVHGRNDPVFPFAQGQATRDFFIRQNGCNTTQTATWAPEPAACVEYKDCQPDLPVVWCVHDEDHAWPTLAAPDCSGGVCFDAGAAIWAFFSSFH